MIDFSTKFDMLFEKDQKENLLNNAFDIKLSYSLNNKLYRNLSGESILYESKKFSFILNGEGEVEITCKSTELYFISSSFIDTEDVGSGICLFFNKNDNKIFKELKNGQMQYDLDKKNSNFNSDLQSFLPYFKCHINSFTYYDSKWELRLEEI